MNVQVVLEGGCQCGAVRYRASAQPRWIGHCHCRMCQKAHGAPVVSWFAVPAEHVTFTKGTLKHYRSSEKTRRGFCPECGTPITCIPDPKAGEPPYVDLALATLDDPKALRPTVHVWCDSAMPWLPINDGLPRHARGPSTVD